MTLPDDKLERYEEALRRIDEWCQAYPLDVFPPVDLAAARKAVEDAGINWSALHAEWARHIVRGIDGIAESALRARAAGSEETP